MKTLFLIRGMPGSGKSTLAKQFLTGGIVDAIVEEDDFFVNKGLYVYDASKQVEAANWCLSKAKEALVSGKSVAIPNVCGTKHEVERYKRLATDQGAKFVSLIVEGRHNGWKQHCVGGSEAYKTLKTFNVEF